MGAFSIKKKLYGDSKNIPSIAERTLYQKR